MNKFGPITPVLRMFDVDKAREFYVDYLGCEVGFEHRFGENFPLYLGLSIGGCNLHLSEHHGDGSLGANLRIGCDDLEAYWQVLDAKDYAYAKPGKPGETPWGSLEMTITDPFGNRLTLVQEASGTQ